MRKKISSDPLTNANETILVTGATGYIGGRLVPRLLKKGYKVIAAGRSLEKLKNRSWSNDPNLKLVSINVLEPSSLSASLKEASIAFYLIHSMTPESNDFTQTDRIAAENFVEMANESNLKRIIYLGGLGHSAKTLSKHLKSRHEVAEILKNAKVPVTIFRSAMIIGSGSASFEILRYLVDRLPLMVTPKWVKTPCQPIFISNVLNYLIQCLNIPETIGKTFDIGGPDVLTYEEMIRLYAEIAELPRRIIIHVPFLTPFLSSQWIGLVSPIPPALAKPLVEGLSSPVVCEENRIRELIPQKLASCREAISRSIDASIQNKIETSWSDAGTIPPAEWLDQKDPDWAGGTYFKEERSIAICGKKEEVWEILMRIGGQTGWYSHQWLWTIRGFIDRLVGGIGLRRGRRDFSKLNVGDAVDFWRVKIIDLYKRLVLVAEMKLPGNALLEFNLYEEAGKTNLKLSAHFIPNGLGGILYWALVSPFHLFIFKGMLKEIQRQHLLHRKIFFSNPVELSFKSFYYSSIDAKGEVCELSIEGCKIIIKNFQEEIPNKLFIYFVDAPFSAKAYLKWQNKQEDHIEITLHFLEMDPTSREWLEEKMGFIINKI